MKATSRKKWILLALLATALCCLMPLRIHASDLSGEKTNGLTLQGKYYTLYKNGIQITEPGWQEFPGEKFQISSQGLVTARMKQAGKTWQFYKYNAATLRWEPQQNAWAAVSGKRAATRDYYFNPKGVCTKIYNPITKKCEKYNNGAMTSVKKEVCTLRDGKMYFFNSKGLRISQAGWQPLSKTKRIQTAQGGRVVSRLEKKQGFWRLSKYDYRQAKWILQKKTWRTINKKRYFFNSSGKCTRIYNTVSHKCYDCEKGRTTLVKNATRNIHGKPYYFTPKGVKANSAGLYLTASKKLIRVRASGRVTKTIPGKVLEYSTSKGKVMSSRVKDSHYMCYYNSKGVLERKLNLNKKMAALTYDDGPSQYTPIILDVLEKYNSRATFFVVGDRVASYSSTVKRTQEMGCEIGNHTYSHSILTSIGVPSIQSQIAMTNQTVQNVTGIAPTIMRPPGGGYNATVRSAVGMPLILWSIDTLDWKTRSAPATQAAVLNCIRDGDVVLMHDLHGPTAEASKTIIPELVNRGYQLVTVSELAQCRGGMSNGSVYSAWRR